MIYDSCIVGLRGADSSIQNAFSSRLAATGFDIFSALVVDLLHEFEIGVWKSLFNHLLRVLQACGGTKEALANELDER